MKSEASHYLSVCSSVCYHGTTFFSTLSFVICILTFHFSMSFCTLSLAVLSPACTPISLITLRLLLASVFHSHSSPADTLPKVLASLITDMTGQRSMKISLNRSAVPAVSGHGGSIKQHTWSQMLCAGKSILKILGALPG